MGAAPRNARKPSISHHQPFLLVRGKEFKNLCNFLCKIVGLKIAGLTLLKADEIALKGLPLNGTEYVGEVLASMWVIPTILPHRAV